MIKDEKLLKGLRGRYPNVHPLIFCRSAERARTAGELFDILESLPDLPMIWCESSRRWQTAEDVYQTASYLASRKSE